MHSEMHQEKNGEPEILKENPRVSRSRPCRVKREMKDRRARIGAGCAASKEKWKGGDHARNRAMFTLVTGYRYKFLKILLI